VLVATLGVADGGHVRDVDDEQVEVGLDRSPAQALYRIAVVQAKFRVIDWDHPASNLDLAFVAIGSGHDAVHQDPVVDQEIGRLS
jgi:hypothetical protein